MVTWWRCRLVVSPRPYIRSVARERSSETPPTSIVAFSVHSSSAVSEEMKWHHNSTAPSINHYLLLSVYFSFSPSLFFSLPSLLFPPLPVVLQILMHALHVSWHLWLSLALLSSCLSLIFFVLDTPHNP